jgi:hypothetical protein
MKRFQPSAHGHATTAIDGAKWALAAGDAEALVVVGPTIRSDTAERADTVRRESLNDVFDVIVNRCLDTQQAALLLNVDPRSLYSTIVDGGISFPRRSSREARSFSS